MRVPVYDLHTLTKQRVCDALVENNEVLLEFKWKKDRRLVNWRDLESQVHAAMEMSEKNAEN